MTAVLKIKLMPSSPDVDFEKIKKKCEQIIKKNKGKNLAFEEEPIAFGLKSLIAKFFLEEDIEVEPIERELEKIPEVSSFIFSPRFKSIFCAFFA